MILASISDQGQLTEELERAIHAATTKQALEDLYQPYRRKKKSRARDAREKGLEPLADALLARAGETITPEELAAEFVDAEKGVATAADAIAGARDILAERVADDAGHRAHLRGVMAAEARLAVKVVTGKEEKGSVYRDYFDHREPLARAPSHRRLAIFRGERAGVLLVTLEIDDEREIDRLVRSWGVSIDSPCGKEVADATRDGYRRLLRPSITNEIRASAREQAEGEAIRVFRANLEALLLQPPLGQLHVMGIDPGYRTGCKIAVVDGTGKVLATSTIFPTPPEARPEEAAATIVELTRKHQVSAIAVGNGTGSRETETFARAAIRDHGGEALSGVIVTIVPETGASVYSASPLAREELPELDVAHRGAVSIARRLQDPLAELVKITPKSLGVGQYQHDVNQKQLASELDFAVESVVNSVGVELNTASVALLRRVSGLSERLARSVVAFRDEHGRFGSRQDLLGVSGFGPRTFEQSAGFLRIRGDQPSLDGTAIHPERYELVEAMAGELGVDIGKLIGEPELVSRVDFSKFVDVEQGIGEFTLRDIRAELERPGRDPRPKFATPKWRDDVQSIEDVQPEMVLEGRVSNVTNFGAFVDIGVKRDGLVHLSELSHRWVQDPREVIHVGQVVKVKVVEVDRERERITLSMKALQPKPRHERGRRKKRGQAQGKRRQNGGERGQRGTRDELRRSRPPRKPREDRRDSGPVTEKDLHDLLDKFKRRW